jgi:hypothetical protein
MRPLRASIALALSIATAACGEPTAASGLAMRVSLDRDQVVRSDSVRVTLTITNVSRAQRTVTAPESYGMCLRAFRVITADKRSVALPEFLCAAITIVGPQPLVLAPGSSVTVRDHWRPESSTIDGQALPAGRYGVVGRYLVEEGTLEGKPIAIEVLP